MENTDYEKAKAKAWARFWDENMKGKPIPTIRISEVFDDAFKEAYRYGRFVGMEEAKAQPESTSNHIPEAGGKVDRTMIVETPIDWEQRRYELAKAVIQGIWTQNYIEMTMEEVAKEAIEQADALIAELKKEEK